MHASGTMLPRAGLHAIGCIEHRRYVVRIAAFDRDADDADTRVRLLGFVMPHAIDRGETLAKLLTQRHRVLPDRFDATLKQPGNTGPQAGQRRHVQRAAFVLVRQDERLLIALTATAGTALAECVDVALDTFTQVQ